MHQHKLPKCHLLPTGYCCHSVAYLRKCSFLRYLKANYWYLLADTVITDNLCSWITDSGKVESNHRIGNLCPALPFKLLPLSKGESDCNGHICVSYGSGFHQAVKCCGISLDRYQPDGLSPPLTVVLTGVEEITYLSRKKRYMVCSSCPKC